MLYGKEKIEEFIDKVLSTDEAFTIADGGSSPDWYIQTRVSKSKFVYETKSYNGEGDARIPGFSAEFVAMVTDGKVYISMPVSYFLSDDEWPKNLVCIEEKAVAYQEEGEQMVDEFYETLKPADIKASDTWRLNDIWKLARSCLMGLNTPETIIRERRPKFTVSVSQAYALESWRMDLKDIVDAHSDCSHPLRSGVLREGRYAPFSNTSRPWLVVSPGRELFAPCGEKDPPTHACLLRNLPKKVVCAKTSTFQLRKMVTHLHAADAQPLAELAPRRMRLSCRLSVRALGESYDSLPLPKQRPAC